MSADRIAVTPSGVSALVLAMQALVGRDDEVVAVVPVWPNPTAQPAILGARVTRVSRRVVDGARGGPYAFIRMPGSSNSLALTERLVTDFGLGLTPGVAFGPQGVGGLCWCFASRNSLRLVAATRRLASALGLYSWAIPARRRLVSPALAS